MKFYKKAIAVATAAALSCCTLAACAGNDPEDPQRYTVRFDANGGTLVSESVVTVEQGDSITLPSATYEDRVLQGWYSGTTLVGAAGASYTPTESVTLTAEWLSDLPDLSDYASVNSGRAVEYAKLIKNLYWDSSTKLSKLTPSGGTPYLWPYTEQVSMVNGILLAMDADDGDRAFFADYLEELLYGLRYYRVRSVSDAAWQNDSHKLADFGVTDGTANSYAIYNSGRNESAIDSVAAGMSGIFFDDNIWVAKEFYYAYLNLGDIKYLNEAVNIVNWIVGEGYESTKGLTGIYWKWSARYRFDYGSNGTQLSDDYHASLNACSSAPTAMMLAKLCQTLGSDGLKTKFSALATDYRQKAEKIYEFCYSTLRNTENGCLRDKIFLKEGFETQTDKTKQIEMYDEQILPYNTGTFMTAGAELYRIAQSAGNTALAKVYLARNRQTASDADKKFANTQVIQGQYSYNSNSWFTSFLLEGFIDLSESVEECDVYIGHMRSALDYAWNNCRADDNLVCPAWIQGWQAFTDNGANSEGNPRQILLQSANAHCYAMLARYYAE